MPVYFPHLNIGGAGFGGGGFYWDQRPKGEAFNAQDLAAARLALPEGRPGIARRATALSYVSSTTNFNFNTGADRGHLQQPGHPAQRRPVGHLPAGRARRLVADDRRPGARSAHAVLGHVLPGRLEAEPRITLNLGIRNDYEIALVRSGAQLLARARPLAADSGDAGESAEDAGAGDVASSATTIWKWNGQWQWTDPSHPGMWNAPKLALQPRAGIAIRVNDKTSIRAGYARYTIPTDST